MLRVELITDNKLSLTSKFAQYVYSNTSATCVCK